MTALELQAQKAELARRILNSDSEELITTLLNLYDKLSAPKYPCDYTKAEVLKACEESLIEYKAGGGIPHDKIKRKVL